MIALTVIATSVTYQLPPDIFWEDEHKWSPVAQTIKQLLPDSSGESSLLIQETVKASGRFITLATADSIAPMRLDEVQALEALAATRPTLRLTMDGRPDRTVRFRFSDGPAVEASAFGTRPNPEPPQAGGLCRVTIRLIEV